MRGPNVSPTKLVLIAGSLRAGSTNLAVLRTAEEVAPPNASLSFYAGLADLPHFGIRESIRAVVTALVAHVENRSIDLAHWAD
jgi:chromate reductase, NAD(P)H dehydrogenase (quinone)